MPSKKLIESIVLDGVTGTQNGTWVDVTSWRRLTIHVDGISGDTVKIYGSCAPSIPADAVNLVEMTSLTEDTIVEVTSKLKWVKVRCSTYSAGTINAYICGESTAYGV